jgi:hypothetical protein
MYLRFITSGTASCQFNASPAAALAAICAGVVNAAGLTEMTTTESEVSKVHGPIFATSR